MIGRREFITLLGGAAVSWPMAARAQQPATRVIGFLSAGASDTYMDAFRRGLSESGYIEGQNLTIEYRWAEGKNDRLPALAADLVQRQVSAIVVTSGQATLVAKEATESIPIVFCTGGDPVKLGLVASLSRPGGNVTGISFLVNVLGEKRLALLRDLVPTATTIGLLVNPTNPNAEAEVSSMQAAARVWAIELHVLNASSEETITEAFAKFVPLMVNAVIVGADAYFLNRRDQFVALGARHAIPAMYHLREIVAAGGLMSYGTSLSAAFRETGVYTARILNGEKPADVPAIQSTKFELVINLYTAKALGLTVPPTLLALADEVIE